MSSAEAVDLEPLPKDADRPGKAKLGAVNEVTIAVGQRPDQYVTVPVTLLEGLNKLVVNGRIVEFRKAGNGREVLMSCMNSKSRKPANWHFVFNKDAKRTFRITEGRLVRVVWE